MMNLILKEYYGREYSLGIAKKGVRRRLEKTVLALIKDFTKRTGEEVISITTYVDSEDELAVRVFCIGEEELDVEFPEITFDENRIQLEAEILNPICDFIIETEVMVEYFEIYLDDKNRLSLQVWCERDDFYDDTDDIDD
jgi:hypothetical protein